MLRGLVGGGSGGGGGSSSKRSQAIAAALVQELWRLQALPGPAEAQVNVQILDLKDGFVKCVG